MKSTLRSTTALIAALATVTPGLTMAQTAPLAAGQAQAEGQTRAETGAETGAEGKSDPDHGRVSTGKENKAPGQARQNSCIETQSQNGVSAKAAADLCEGMTASAPGSEAEKRSEDAIQKQARQKAEDSTEEARKAMGGGNAKAAAQDDAADDTAQAKPAAKGTAKTETKAEVTAAPEKDAEAKSGAQTQAQTQAQADEDAKPRAQAAATGETPSEGGKVDALKRKLEGKATESADQAQDDQALAKEPLATKTAPDAKSTDAGAADATSAQAQADADAKADMPAEEKSADRDTATPAPQQSAGKDAPETANDRTDPDSLAKALAGKQDAPDADVKPEAKADADAQAQADAQAAPEPRDPQAADAGTKEAGANGDNATKADESRRVEEALAATEDAQKRATEGAPVKNEALAAEAEMPRDGDAKDAAAEDPKMTEEVITKENARSSNEDFTTAVNAKAQDRDRDDKDEGLSDFEKVAIAGLGALAVGAILNNGSEVAVNSGDRVVVQNPDGSYGLIKDDNALLRQPGARISTRNYDDGSTRTITRRDDGAQIVTVYDAQRRIVQRTRIEPDGTRYVLIDDSQGAEPVRISDLPRANFRDVSSTSDESALRDALARSADTDRGFTLSQVRQIADVRDLAPAISVENVTFETGSAAIRPAQAEELSQLGEAIKARIDENPREIFLIEGHTDAVGNAAYNLALSDRRAESMALALTEYFDIPPENLVVQGYGEEYLKVDTQGASEENRRVTVRRVTDLLRVASN